MSLGSASTHPPSPGSTGRSAEGAAAEAGREGGVCDRPQLVTPFLLAGLLEKGGSRRGAGAGLGGRDSEERRELQGLALPGRPAIGGQDCADPALQGRGRGDGRGGRPGPCAPGVCRTLRRPGG